MRVAGNLLTVGTLTLPAVSAVLLGIMQMSHADAVLQAGVLWLMVITSLLLAMRLRHLEADQTCKDALAETEADISELRAELAALKASTEPPVAQLREHLAAIEGTLKALSDDRVAVATALAARAAQQVSSPAVNIGLPIDRLDLYLQPVVDLATGETAAYRTSMMLRLPDGSLGAADPALARAGEAMLAALDIHRLERIEQVSARLQSRNSNVFLIVRLNVASLATPDRVSALLNRRERAAGIYAGVVFEITNSAFSLLTTPSMPEAQGLQRLVDAGAAFCIAAGTGTPPRVVDMAQHGVRFVVMPAEILAHGGPVLDAESAAAMASGMEIIAAGITTPEQQEAVAPVASLGFGPSYAAPRLVRPMDAGFAPPDVSLHQENASPPPDGPDSAAA